MPLWKARKIIEDAYRKKIQDTIILSLETKIDTLESFIASRERHHNQVLQLERGKIHDQAKLITAQTSLVEFYNHKYHRAQRQRNQIIIALSAIVVYNISVQLKLFKPP